MNPDDQRQELDRLANEGARLLLTAPVTGIESLEAARRIALAMGLGREAARLSCLVARGWNRSGLLSQALRCSKRAVADDPTASEAHYTLGHFYEVLAERQGRRGKLRRAARLFLAAGNAFGKRAALRPDEPRSASDWSAVDRVWKQALDLAQWLGDPKSDDPIAPAWHRFDVEGETYYWRTYSSDAATDDEPSSPVEKLDLRRRTDKQGVAGVFSAGTLVTEKHAIELVRLFKEHGRPIPG